MIRKRQVAGLAAVSMLAVVLPVGAQTSKIYREGNAWVEEITGSVPAPESLRVKTEAGSVEVEGGPQSELTYSVKKRVYVASESAARNYLKSFHVSVAKRGKAAFVDGSWAGARVPKFMTEFSLKVPRKLQLARVNTGGGPLAIRNLDGEVEAETGGGSVVLSDIGGDISASTSGGGVDVSNTSGELTLQTGGGAIRVAGRSGRINAESGGGTIEIGASQGKANLETGAGNILVKQCNGQLQASTAGGNIDVGEVSGPAALETGGGSIRVGGASGPVTANTGAGTIQLFKLTQGANAETGAGSIIAEFIGMGKMDSRLETSIGDVIVYVGPHAGFTVEAAIQMANGHRIRSDFGELKLTSDEGGWGPVNVFAEGDVNGGGPVLKISTVSGSIELRRATQ